eukprot:TRINITY_DN49673_c0_g1_i1.p1 TRINITY_DN49673_c0_g1~~TRINITY_DN49673_c0_g1_i1.p1  ORF type:complete len:145 (+),score=42.48 TRINITY_DN49673_c0_g1_i1:48-482(+)
MYHTDISQSRAYSGFPGCKRNDGASVNAILTTLSSMVLVLQMVLNISNSNNNENKKNENNQNNNNNNNVETFDNIFISMNENESMATMTMMLGRQFSNYKTLLWAWHYFGQILLKPMLSTSNGQRGNSILNIYKAELATLLKFE